MLKQLLDMMLKGPPCLYSKADYILIATKCGMAFAHLQFKNNLIRM